MNDVDVYLTKPHLIQNNFNEGVAENQTVVWNLSVQPSIHTRQ